LTPNLQGSRSTGTQFLLAAASVVVVLAGMRAAAPFLVPLTLALSLTIVNLPVLGWLRRLRVPAPLAVLLVLLLTIAVLGGLVWIGAASLSDIRESLPMYVRRLQEVEYSLIAALAARGIEVPEGLYADFAAPERLVGFVSGVLIEAAAIVSAAFVVVLYVIFMLAEAAGFPRKLRAAIGRRDADLGRLTRMVRDIQRYLAIKTVISLATGLLIGVSLWAIGVDFPLFWGLVAFLLNFIPNVGSIVAAVPGILFALLQLGPGGAALAATAYLAVNLLLGTIIEPHVMGRGFGLSTLVVVVTLIFWGWLWGPVGMLLSVPLTVAVKIAIEHTEDLRWLAVILGSGPMDDPALAPAVEGDERLASAGGVEPGAGVSPEALP